MTSVTVRYLDGRGTNYDLMCQRSGPVAAMAATVRPVAGDLTGDLRDDVLAYVPGTTRDPLLLGRDTGLG